jgi:hypothetical protein
MSLLAPDVRGLNAQMSQYITANHDKTYCRIQCPYLGRLINHTSFYHHYNDTQYRKLWEEEQDR